MRISYISTVYKFCPSLQLLLSPSNSSFVPYSQIHDSPEYIGSVEVIGEGRKREEQRKMYSTIKNRFISFMCGCLPMYIFVYAWCPKRPEEANSPAPEILDFETYLNTCPKRDTILSVFSTIPCYR